MIKPKNTFVLLLFSFLFTLSCQKKENKIVKNNFVAKKYDSLVTKNSLPTVQKKDFENLDFPNFGKNASDFASTTYEIQYEANGDLNGDHLNDIAVVLRHKKDTLSDRIVLVLIKNPDKTYRLDKISKKAFPKEYSENGFKFYTTENIDIKNGDLKIDLYGVGPAGNIFSKYKYMNNNLVLKYIEEYNIGAGSQQSIYYEPLIGKFTQHITNTMIEEMPSTAKTIKVKQQQFLFENDSPEDVVTQVINNNNLLNI